MATICYKEAKVKQESVGGKVLSKSTKSGLNAGECSGESCRQCQIKFNTMYK